MGFTHVQLLPDQRAPVHRQLGLSDDRLLRRDEPLRHAAGLHALRRSAPPERHRRDHRLGAGPLPQRRPRPAPVRWHVAVRARRPAQGRASGLGHADLQLRPQRSPQLPALERLVLARQVPHRWAARRCGRLDAVPRLQPQRGRVGAEHVRRPRKPRSDRLPQEVQRGSPPAVPGRADDRRRIDRLDRRFAADVSSAASASRSSGTWAG